MRKIELSLETAERWYNGTDSELKGLASQTYPELVKKELPKSWEELGQINGYWVNGFDRVDKEIKVSTNNRLHTKQIFATKEQAEASIALAQLSQLKAVYNGDWVADWKNFGQSKYTLSFESEQIKKATNGNVHKFLSFKDSETRNLFLENFRELILKAKALLS